MNYDKNIGIPHDTIDDYCCACEFDIARMERKLAPMGVSQWREYGKKRGYWKYFEKEINDNKK